MGKRQQDPIVSAVPVPEVGWSDWGSVERILTSLKQMGKLEETVARAATIAKERDVTPTWSMANGRRIQDSGS